MERIGTDKMRPGGKGARQFIEDSRIAKMILKLTGVIGVALVMSGMTLKKALKCPSTDSHKDGVLTPAQSVLGAIQG